MILTKKLWIKYLLVHLIFILLCIIVCTIQTVAIEYANNFNNQNVHLPSTFDIEYSNEVEPGSQQTIKINIKKTSGGYFQIEGYKLNLDDFGLGSPPIGSTSIPIASIGIADASLAFKGKIDCDVSGGSPVILSSKQITINDFGESQPITVQIDKDAKDGEEIKIVITPYYTINAKLKAKVVLIGEQELGSMDLMRINGNPMIVNMKVKKPFSFMLIAIIFGIIIIFLIVFLIWRGKKTPSGLRITTEPPVRTTNNAIDITPNIITCNINILCPADGTLISKGERAFRCRTCGAIYHPSCVKLRLRTSNNCLICKKSLM